MFRWRRRRLRLLAAASSLPDRISLCLKGRRPARAWLSMLSTASTLLRLGAIQMRLRQRGRSERNTRSSEPSPSRVSNRVQVRPPFASNNDPSRDAESCCDGLAIYQDENAPPLSRRREGVARLEGRQWRRAEGFPSREAIRRDDSGRRD